ncbi:MAG: ABC transporter permease subunit [Planctomycetota bacterium]|nr:MAG: ABC transporter permease subunit [Planctomycetota bacterium]REJ93703.1 MAG: ABC transporter permease subunit [Planctomycetota bacterium]REK25751.1 MAG: ABC transporter permease subunit [Planctomycetota bacterium]REK46501.1 MAG: ABC transporter permease subunit [Planctomycetota bacterium]
MMRSSDSASLTRIRLRRFRRIKRGYYSFLLLVVAYALTFLLPFVMSNRAIVVRYDGAWYFPAFRSYFHDIFGIGSANVVRAGDVGQTRAGGFRVPADAEALYRDLKRQYVDDAELYRSLSPLARKALLGEPLTEEQQRELANLEQREREETAAEQLAALEQDFSPLARKFASGRRLSPRQREQYEAELQALSADQAAEARESHQLVRQLVKEYPLARRLVSGRQLSDEQQAELRELLAGAPTMLERAREKQLSPKSLENFVLMPFFEYSPYEKIEGLGHAPAPPQWPHVMGTDAAHRDILIRMVYAFRMSITLALIVVGTAYTFGTLTGALLGYFGRWVDIVGLRLVEIWGAIPFLYTVMILGQIFGKNFFLLCGILAAFGWMGITYFIRGEFYREKSRDYVAAAVATGESEWAIIIKHILPNALTPIITYAPFAMVAAITSLVALDYLGFGLPASEPSWGQLLRQGKDSGLDDWHLIVFPLTAMFLTLQLIVFIGEAVREAFDPKVFNRLR